jgi:hypothetical protein
VSGRDPEAVPIRLPAGFTSALIGRTDPVDSKDQQTSASLLRVGEVRSAAAEAASTVCLSERAIQRAKRVKTQDPALRGGED